MLTWAFVSTSCSDYLDKTPDDATSITLEEVFSSEIYTERFLLRAYDYLPCETNYNDNDYWALGAWSGASDEMNITWTYPMAKEMNRGSWNPKMLEGSSSQGTSYAMWWRYYEGIRQCNVFLENIDLCPAAQATKNVWICEARFMRAMLHFFLLRSHGPIPIMDHALKMDDEMTYFPRNTFDQCVDFIVSDCQYGIDGALPMIYTNASGTVAESLYGRATKAAAYALKARVLLYAASPLFNGNADYAKFANEDGTLLFAPKDDSKWGKAAAAAKEAIDKIEGSSYYGLYYSDEPDNGYRNYMELFLPSKKWNKEYIFARNQGTGYSDNIHQEKCMAANGMGGDNGYVLSGSGDKTNVVFGSAGKEKEVYAPYTTMQKTPAGVETDGQVIVGDDIIVQNFVTPKLPYSPVPVRTPSMVMRIWIASYTDLNGDLNAPGYVYTEIEPRKWIMNPAQAKNSSNFQPLVKKIPVQRNATSSTSNDRRQAENISNPPTVNNLELLKQNRSH